MTPIEPKQNNNILMLSAHLSFHTTLRQTLNPLGAKIYEETNISQAIERLKQHSFKAVISDLMFPSFDGSCPGFDGFRLARIIRRSCVNNTAELPLVIVADTYNEVAAHQLARQFHINAFIPFHRQAELLPGLITSYLTHQHNSNDLPAVLVVDDRQSKVDIVQRAIGDDYQIEIAWDGAAGLKQFQEKSYDLVILDIVLPKISGAELLKKMLTLKPQQKIVMLTGYENYDPRQKLEFLLNGAMDYLEVSNPKGLRRSCRSILFYDAFMNAQTSLQPPRIPILPGASLP